MNKPVYTSIVKKYENYDGLEPLLLDFSKVAYIVQMEFPDGQKATEINIIDGSYITSFEPYADFMARFEVDAAAAMAPPYDPHAMPPPGAPR